MLDFVPASEEQIVQQFHQNRRCDDDVRKAMTLLSKMLAEKRVFGTKLMAQTTVAGPNHSTYKNLPEEGIHYIACEFLHCRLFVVSATTKYLLDEMFDFSNTSLLVSAADIFRLVE